MKPLYIIAEAGVNHNGDVQRAIELIDVAVESNADAIKFQTYQADAIVTQTAERARYQVKNTSSNGSQYDLLKQLELSYDAHFQLKAYCDQKNIDFLSTPFDVESLHFLTQELGLETLKISSGDLTHAALLKAAAQSNCNLILSTGMIASAFSGANRVNKLS